MKFRDIKLPKTKRYEEKINYGLEQIEAKEDEIRLYEEKLKELKKELEELKNRDPKDVRLPQYADAIWIGGKRVR